MHASAQGNGHLTRAACWLCLTFIYIYIDIHIYIVRDQAAARALHEAERAIAKAAEVARRHASCISCVDERLRPVACLHLCTYVRVYVYIAGEGRGPGRTRAKPAARSVCPTP